MNFSDAVAQKEKLDELRKQQAQTAQQMVGQCGQEMQGLGRRASLREEAEKNADYHRDFLDKQVRAAAFFREHPEFDEFIQLIRAGVVAV